MINSETKLCAVLGHPISHSMSPAMHNAMYEKHGLNFCYLAFDVLPERLREAIEAMKALDIKGYSVTIPHKINAMQYLDWIEPLASKIGAVNTIVNENGKLKGYNTDVFGAISALNEKTSIKGKKILLLGAGGAARAIAFGVSDEGAKLSICDIIEEKAIALAKEASAECVNPANIDDCLKDCDILINATGTGMNPNIEETPIPAKNLNEHLVVFDIVYNPVETRLLREAKANGCETINGIRMFALQGARQFELFTGCKPSVEFMEEIVLEKLGQKR
ncbi:MAG: shikimate dehydrogenase [Candidatus Diapherotrites archaeon]|nr:shikimate dehydrogenase [Candidatus Diapherotrites archaeon]